MDEARFSDKEVIQLARKYQVPAGEATVFFSQRFCSADVAYRFCKRFPTPRLPEVRQKLKKVQKATDKLNHALLELDPTTRWWVGVQWPGTSREDGQKRLQQHIEEVQALGKFIDVVLKELPRGRPGPIDDEALEHCVWILAELYQQIMGQKPAKPYEHAHKGIFVGPFLDFVRDCIHLIDPEHPRDKNALGRYIRRYWDRVLRWLGYSQIPSEKNTEI